jgi:Spy/CpxP family protein refolding chaperone
MNPEPSYQVAKAARRRKMPAMRPLALFFVLAATVVAQSDGTKPPPPKPGEGGQPYRDGERRGPPGMMPGKGKPQRGFDGFEKLSEAEKQKVRTAFEKAWQRPEVIESRDKAMRANEEMRNTLHAVLKEIDPEVVGILEKIKPPFPVDQRGLPEMPKPESPDFARVAAMRLGAEMLSMARPERREETRRFHERIMQLPRVKEAFAKLEQLPPEQRLEAFHKLRDTYREVVGQEFAKVRERGESKEGKDGFRRPPEDGKPETEKKE